MQVLNLKLHEMPLFAGLKPAEIEKFVEAVGAVIRRYARGERVLSAYAENASIGLIIEGRAETVTEDCWGKESVSHTLGRGELIGATSAVLSDTQYNISSIDALADVLVLWIPFRALLTSGVRLGRIHGIVMMHLLESFSTKNVTLTEKIELLSQKTLRERLIVYLLQREKRQSGKNGHVDVPGRVRLAQELDCNRSALTREITAMKRDGLLDGEDDWLTLNKKAIGLAPFVFEKRNNASDKSKGEKP